MHQLEFCWQPVPCLKAATRRISGGLEWLRLLWLGVGKNVKVRFSYIAPLGLVLVLTLQLVGSGLRSGPGFRRTINLCREIQFWGFTTGLVWSQMGMWQAMFSIRLVCK